MYLDNAATTFPKPEPVIRAINDCLRFNGAVPGRSGHSLALKASREVFETRELIATFFNAANSDRVIFTNNATTGLNMAMKGILNKGDHVIISNMEHNSVYRPLRHLEHQGIIELSAATCDETGLIDLNHLITLFRPNTRMVVINHGSNVLGTVQPVNEIGRICRRKNVILLVDAAQTAGFIPIDMKTDRIDILIFSGHKKLYGPQGTGGMVINTEIQIEPLMQGGTGSRSESDIHPGFYPDRLEAGTPNTPGIIGLKAGLTWVMDKGLSAIKEHQLKLTRLLIEGFKQIEGVRVFNPGNWTNRLPIVSIIVKNLNPAEVALKLDTGYGIQTRPGLQCAPLAHKAAGTFPEGTVRLSPGAFNTEKEIMLCVDALQQIVKTH